MTLLDYRLIKTKFSRQRAFGNFDCGTIKLVNPTFYRDKLNYFQHPCDPNVENRIFAIFK